MGFLPNSLLTMGHKPDILRRFTALLASTLGDGCVSPALKSMVAEVASTAAGCRYCQAHGALIMSRAGIDAEKAAALWEYETSPRFDEAERAALDLARNAALVPNGVTAEHFAAIRAHFSDEQIVEIVAVVATFGFLNRWNDTMATDLEEIPLTVASDYLADTDWAPGKHGADSASG
ncbi:MAG: carboxymuconolactone decarboxylase family protein [Actinophytocola sp.]|nr:carboxymuconolactone decarboxylase family protein [Actinophytocola sp.]